MKKTFRVNFKHGLRQGYFKAVNSTIPEMFNWEACPTISNCAIARFLQKNLPEAEDIKSAKVTIEFDQEG